MSRWEYKPLSEACNYVNSKVLINNVGLDNYISTENMITEKGGVTKATTLPDANSVSAYTKNDILTSNIRPYFKKIWFAKNSGGCSNDVLVLRANKTTYSKFLYYALSDNNFFNYATTSSKGTKMPRGSKEAIMKYLIPDIPSDIQQKIADILSAYDDLIENNNRRIELLEQAAQQLHKEWFVRFRFPGYETAHFTKGIPAGWEVVKLEDVINFYNGKAINSMEIDGHPIYGSNGIIGYSKTALYENGIILGRVGAYCGSVELCKNKFWASDNTIVVKPKQGANIWFYYYLLNRMNLNMYAGGAAQPLITQGVLKRVKILLPAIQFLTDFDNKINIIHGQIQTLQAKNQNLIKQRDLLLPRLMSGKMEV